MPVLLIIHVVFLIYSDLQFVLSTLIEPLSTFHHIPVVLG